MISTAFLALSLFGVGSAVNRAPVQKLNPETVAKPVGAYSHLAIVPPGMRLLYLAGQIGNRPDGSLAPTVEEQVVQAYDNVLAILRSQGAGPQHIVKVTIYASAKPTNWAPIRDKRAAIFEGMEPPPSTWLYVSGLIRPEYLVEIEVVAAVPDQAGRRRFR
jgi:2-iminobutanoate/2-iminopropanoate deaminase